MLPPSPTDDEDTLTLGSNSFKLSMCSAGLELTFSNVRCDEVLRAIQAPTKLVGRSDI